MADQTTLARDNQNFIDFILNGPCLASLPNPRGLLKNGFAAAMLPLGGR